MNIKFANRLVELRKANGLSQEALAEKLGLSRQAISKWERGEASPDTDNLIALAEIYGTTLDELLGKGRGQTVSKSKTSKTEKTLNQLQLKGKKMLSIFPVLTLATVAVYVLGGLIFHTVWWANLWILFLIIPTFLTVALALFFGKSKQITALALTVPVSLVAVIVFLCAGLYLKLWSIAWIVFLAIPVYAYLAFLKTKNK